MGWLVGLGSGAYGAVVGGIVYYFVARLEKFDAQALKVVVTLLGAAAVLYLVQSMSVEPTIRTIAFASYPIGLLFGWGIPILLGWGEKQNLSNRSDGK